MSTSPIPAGYHSLTPYLIVNGAAQAIEFYKTVFDAQELFRLQGGPGKIAHAELLIGDSHLMLADEFPEMEAHGPAHYGGSPLSLMVYVPDAEEAFFKALEAGASLKRPLADQFYGDRSGMVVDPFGHTWTIATHIEDVSPEEMTRRMAEFEKNLDNS
jgi:PhnB protein